MSAAPPPYFRPPLAAPPPPGRGLFLAIGLTALIILIGAFFLLAAKWGQSKALFAGQMALITLAVCLVPTIASGLIQNRGRVVRILTETALFATLLVTFSYWLFGAGGLGVWIAYALALTLLLEVGSHIIERYIAKTAERISQSAYFTNLRHDAEAIQKMFRREAVLYVSVPLGLISGTAVGLFGDWTKQATIIFCVQLVLGFAGIILAAFLINGTIRMSAPLLKPSPAKTPAANEDTSRQASGLFGQIGKLFKPLLPHPQTGTEDQQERDLSLALIATDLRKAYLYDSIHNIILSVAFASAIASLWGITVDMKQMLQWLLGLGLVFSQVPFIAGQLFLHETLLDRYEGTRRMEIAERLKKIAPLFPTIDVLTSLFATGTAGGLFYFLLDQSIKNALK